MHEQWIDDVLAFWFEELEPKKWFARDAQLDAAITARFAEIYERVRREQPRSYDSPRATLAAVITLDQFPRNMFRGSPRAFESDASALAIASAAIDRGFDRALTPQQRTFLYMPFQHSEDAQVQAQSEQLFQQLGQPEALDYARQHRNIIDRFGRFPHRNHVLRRTSTDEELEFLKTHPVF